MDYEAKFPVECIEDIFRHLNGIYLLECTLVSPQWNDFIGSTQSCMSKIQLECGRGCSPEEIEIMLKNSNRKYECIDLDKHSCEEVEKLLLVKNRRWTHIFMRRLQFQKFKHFLDFLGIFQSTVRKLVIDQGEIIKRRDQATVFLNPDLQFP